MFKDVRLTTFYDMYMEKSSHH